jgi:hypothetical protein
MKEFIEHYKRVTLPLHTPYYHNTYEIELPYNKTILELPCLKVGGHLQRINGYVFDLLDSEKNHRGTMEILSNGYAKAEMDAPKSSDFKSNEDKIQLTGRIKNISYKTFTSLEDALKSPREYCVDFSENKNKKICLGKDNNENDVSLHYNGGLWFKFSWLQEDKFDTYFGASFSTLSVPMNS